MNNFIVIINEQHKILPSQEAQIKDTFGKIEEKNIVRVPANGWTLDEMKQVIETWTKKEYPNIVFISPIPYMIREYTELAFKYIPNSKRVWLFHNDKREKTETPDGKIFYKINPEGWQLI